jgi:succinyl-diaminopimelate desuccinylase
MIDVLKVVNSLIAIRSVENNKTALRDALQYSTSLLKKYPVQQFTHEGVESLLFSNTTAHGNSFHLILNAHLDVVEGTEDQYKSVATGDRLYGRGAYDMKAAAAVMICVFAKLAKKVNYPLGLQLVTDEEIGGEGGALHQVKSGVTTSALIVGEPTNLDIVNASKAKITVSVKSIGKSAHAAYPWLGKNAIHAIVKYISDIQKMYPTPDKPTWQTTIVPSIISTTNTTHNNIPRDCKVQFDIRLPHGEQHKVLNDLQSLLPKHMSLTVDLFDEGMDTPKNDAFVKMLADTTSKITGKNTTIRPTYGSSDARHYPKKTSTVEFGPIGAGHHTDQEWVSIKSLNLYYDILYSLVKKLGVQIE